MKKLKRRGDCIGGCGQSVRVPGSECRKCRRARVLKGKRLFRKLEKEAKRAEKVNHG